MAPVGTGPTQWESPLAQLTFSTRDQWFSEFSKEHFSATNNAIIAAALPVLHKSTILKTERGKKLAFITCAVVWDMLTSGDGLRPAEAHERHEVTSFPSHCLLFQHPGLDHHNKLSDWSWCSGLFLSFSMCSQTNRPQMIFWPRRLFAPDPSVTFLKTQPGIQSPPLVTATPFAQTLLLGIKPGGKYCKI